MVNAQEMVVGVVMGELTLPNLYYSLLFNMASSLDIGQIGSLALAVFVSEEKQHSLVQTPSSSIPKKCVRKKGQVLEGKGDRARE